MKFATPRKITLSIGLITIAFVSNVTTCLAQQVIKLDGVAKLVLMRRGGGLSREKREWEVVLENNTWKCYRTRFIGFDIKVQKIVNDSVKTFVKDVPSRTLQQLLNIVAKKDTGINRKLFNIDQAELAKFTDSLQVDLKPSQRKGFIDSLESEQIVTGALEAALKPFLMDDKTYFGITVITKQNTSYTVHAESFAYLYNLPWYIGNIKSFDPNINIIYESICGFDDYPEYEIKRLYRQMAQAVYYKYFYPRFNWDNFKSDEPSSFAIMGNTFIPLSFYKEHGRYFGECKSSLLPQYVHFPFGFNEGDTSAIARIKKYEGTLVKILKNDNLLFNYLKEHPCYTAEFTSGELVESRKYLLKNIQRYFDGVGKFDFKQCQFIVIYKDRKIVSKWILLPDSSLILIKALVNDKEDPLTYRLQFSDSAPFPHLRSVCAVFNASGKIVYNYGVVPDALDF